MSKASGWLRQLLPVLGVFAASLVATFLLWQHEQTNAEIGRRFSADVHLREVIGRIERRMLAQEQLLRGVRGLYSASDDVSREDFRTYAHALQLGADFAGIEGLGRLLLVDAGGKAAHEQEMRSQGFADYAIQPTGERERYAPLVQLEPSVPRNRQGHGFDGYSDPARRLALDKARDSGEPVLTGRLQRLEESGSDVPAAFAMYLALYRQGAPTATVQERRRHLIGWIVAPFRARDLIASLYGDGLQGVDVQIFDGVELTEASLLYDSAQDRGAAVPGAPPAAVEYLVLANHTWTAAVLLRPGFALQASEDKSQLIAGAGLGLSLLLALLAWILLTDRTRAVQMARQMTAQLREAKEHFEMIFDASPDGVVIGQLADFKVIDVNQGFTALTGYRRDEVRGDSLLELRLWSDPEDRQHFATALRERGSCENLEAVFQRKDGHQVVGIVSAKTASFKGVPCVVAVVRDITGRKAAEQRIAHMAQHDTLTGLPNRALLGDRVRLAIAQARRQGGRLALMYIDLDHLKPVNDSLGHHVGDQLLRAVAKRMQDSVRASDTVARVGGDEFVVLLPTIGGEQDALPVAEKVRQALGQPFTLPSGDVVQVSASAGIALFPDHGSDEFQLARAADTAMYRAKALGRDRVEFFRADG